MSIMYSHLLLVSFLAAGSSARQAAPVSANEAPVVNEFAVGTALNDETQVVTKNEVAVAPIQEQKNAVISPIKKNESAPAGTAPEINSVEVRGTADLMRRNDTATKIVITNDELVKYGDPNVLESMKRLPGVTVQGSSVRMRGLGNGYTQFLVNGERPPAGFSLDTLSPDMVERVEIIRAATAEFSTQAIAGTINIVLKRSVSKASKEVKIFAGGAHQQSNGSTQLSMSDRADKLSYTFGANLNYNRNTTPSLNTVEGRAPNGALTEQRTTNSINTNVFQGINLNSRFNWKLQGEDSVTWQTFINAGHFYGINDNHAVTQVGPTYPYPLMVDDFDGKFRHVRTDVNWVTKFEDDGKLDAKLTYNKGQSHRDFDRLGRNATNVLVLDRDYATESRGNGLTSTGKYSTPLLPGHLLAFGWDASRDNYYENEIQDDRPLPGIREFDFDNSFDASTTRLAMFAQDEWDISKDWSLYLGARWESIQTRTTSFGIDSKSKLSVLSPLIQTLYKIPGRKGDQLRFALTKTYKAPVLQQLVPRKFLSAFNTAVSPDYSGNPQLKPELALGIDAAWEHHWAEGALFSVAVSAREIDGLIRNEVRFIGGRYVSAPYNQGKAHVKGLELEAKFPLKAIMTDAPAVDLRASLSRNWSNIDGVPGPGARLERQPRLSANLGFDVRLGQWSGGSSFSYVEGAWTRTSITDSSFSSSRRDLEAYLLYRFTPKIQIRLTARDLLRPDNENVSGFVGPNGSYYSTSVTPVRPGWRIVYEHKL